MGIHTYRAPCKCKLHKNINYFLFPFKIKHAETGSSSVSLLTQSKEWPQWQNVESLHMICDLRQARFTSLMRYCKLVNNFIVLAPQKCARH